MFPEARRTLSPGLTPCCCRPRASRWHMRRKEAGVKKWVSGCSVSTKSLAESDRGWVGEANIKDARCISGMSMFHSDWNGIFAWRTSGSLPVVFFRGERRLGYKNVLCSRRTDSKISESRWFCFSKGSKTHIYTRRKERSPSLFLLENFILGLEVNQEWPIQLWWTRYIEIPSVIPWYLCLCMIFSAWV